VSTSVRAKPYQLAIRGITDLSSSLPVLAADADEMFEILFADLAGVSDDLSDVDVSISVVNDTNVTGSYASGVLTLGWTGTLAAARLNSNVVQGITNDTNVTGSIAAQVLTLAWAGTLSQARGGFGKSSAGQLDGQLPIGKTSDGSWQFATITAGSGVSVTNGAGTITIASTVSAGVAANVALSRVYLRG
jgi:hypothetical protein